MENFLHRLSSALWGGPLLILIVCAGVYFTIKLRLPQIRLLPEAAKVSFGKGGSAFSSLCTFLSAAMGTGNIIGVAVCMNEGGPGAVFWMGLSAFLLMPLVFSESFLAVRYKDKAIGAAGYMKRGKIYSLLGLLSAIFGMGTIVQVNAALGGAENYFFPSGAPNIARVFLGAALSLLVGLVITGSAKRIGKTAEKLVPFLAVVYFFSCAVILIFSYKNIIPAITLIIKDAFSFKSAIHGAAGGAFLMISRGISMGVFTNETGIGTSGIAVSGMGVSSPRDGGLISMFGVFIDTIVMCNLTAVCLIASGAYSSSPDGWEMTDTAFRSGFSFSPEMGSFILMLCLFFFAFASMIGWSYYGEVFFRNLFPKGNIRIYHIAFISLCFLGVFIRKGSLFYITDLFNAFMAFPNIFAVMIHRGEVTALAKTKTS
ncbi:MAG: sodium:alanine symporter family protein [Oscillospiraceae bacterium]|nr:sodium:alanine symporter family protein [Oscillospiraceae bacterium]